MQREETKHNTFLSSIQMKTTQLLNNICLCLQINVFCWRQWNLIFTRVTLYFT